MSWGFIDNGQIVDNPVLTKRESYSCEYAPLSHSNKELTYTATLDIFIYPEGRNEYKFTVINGTEVIVGIHNSSGVYKLFDILEKRHPSKPYGDILMNIVNSIDSKYVPNEITPPNEEKVATKKPRRKGNVLNRCKDNNILPTDYLYTRESLEKLESRLLVNTNKVKSPILNYISASILKLKDMGRNITYIEVGQALLDSIREDMEYLKVQPKVDKQGFVSIQYNGVSVIIAYDPKLDYGYMKMYGTLSTTPQ